MILVKDCDFLKGINDLFKVLVGYLEAAKFKEFNISLGDLVIDFIECEVLVPLVDGLLLFDETRWLFPDRFVVVNSLGGLGAHWRGCYLGSCLLLGLLDRLLNLIFSTDRICCRC